VPTPRSISPHTTAVALVTKNSSCDHSAMDRLEIAQRLRSKSSQFHELGVESLALFGSTATGLGGPDSDVDIAVRLGDGFSAGGLDYFARLDALRAELAALLGRNVDLVVEPVARGEFQRSIDRDRLIAF
jgi:predicted nucleotidyltransferase